jgi:hypothetical protein
MKTLNWQKIQETRNITNYNAQNTAELWSNTLLTEINMLLFINIKRCDFPLYSHCQGQTFPHSVDSNNIIDWSLSVSLLQCVCSGSPSMQPSDMHKFHCQLVAQCLYLMCNTELLHVSAIHFGLLQGTTNSMDVHSEYGNLSQMYGTHTYTHTHTHVLHIYYNNTTVNISLQSQCVLSWCILPAPKYRIFQSSLKQKKHRCLDTEHYC